MEKAKEIVEHIIMMYRADKLAEREIDVNGLAKLVYDYRQEANRENELLITAVKNLLKKENYLELNKSLDDEDISEKEFYKELDKNEEKYIIKTKDAESFEEVSIIMQLMEKIGMGIREFTVDEVEEIFGVMQMEKYI